MSNKPYKGFEPKWVLTPAPADSYRSIFRWGDPNFFKYPKESLYTLMKETFKMTDDDFKAYSDDIGFDPVDLLRPPGAARARAHRGAQGDRRRAERLHHGL
ncbi:MAG: hypothetical protein ACLUNO_05190 [Oscillospiraceae bacterium]